MKKTLLIIVFLAILIGFFALDGAQYLSLSTVKGRLDQLRAWRDNSPLLVAFLFFGLYVFVTMLSLPGAAVLTLVAGALFGLLFGTVLVSFASSVGATLAMLSARYLLSSSIQARFGERLAAIQDGLNKEGAFYLFTLRLIPAVPFFLVNVLMGLTQMKTSTYYWVSQLGMLAGTLVFVNAGTQLANIESVQDVFSPMLIGSFILLGFFPILTKRLIQYVQKK